MLRLVYKCDSSAILYLHRELHGFLSDYTDYPHYCVKMGNRLIVNVHKFAEVLDALQLIHTFDTIIINKGIECELVKFSFD